jgi:CBS-domain-containing membrane protein
MRSLKLAGWALLAAAVVGSIEAVVTNLEMTGPALIVWPLVAPSVLLFVVIERYTVRQKWAAHTGYLVSLLPLTGGCVRLLLGPSGEGQHDIARYVLACYLPEALGSYAILFLSTRRAR